MTETIEPTQTLNYGETCACCSRKLECKRGDKVRIKDGAFTGHTGKVYAVETSAIQSYVNAMFSPVTVVIDEGKGAQRYAPKQLIFIEGEKLDA